MKRRFFVMTSAVFGVAFAVATITGQQRPASHSGIEGVWRAVEVTTTGPNAATNKSPQPSLYIFTAKHYSQMAVAGDKPRPEMAQGAAATATADQLRAAWGPFFANGGTYEVKGGDLIRRALVAKNPGGMPSVNPSTASFKLEGDTLTITTKSNNAGPVPNPTTTKLLRIE